MANPIKTANVITLGCSKNLVDSEKILGALNDSNIVVYHNENKYCDLVIINTCGFILDAKQESIDTIMSWIEAKNQKKIKYLHVIGCLSERYKEDLPAEMPEVDEIFGVNCLEDIVKAIQLDVKTPQFYKRKVTTPNHYAYLKVSEGCDRSCSFCAIPAIRGKHISQPIDALVKEAELLVENGTKEIMLIAQDLSYYGLDIYGKRSLGPLLTQLESVKDLEWIRLHYAYPTQFPMDVMDIMRDSEKICHYLDIPIQHISDIVLKNMRRGHSGDDMRNLLHQFREKVPDIALRTTMLVGHPGEGEKEFNELIQFVQEFKFDRLGAFAYSEEEDTYAANNFEDSISQEEKDARVEQLMNIQSGISNELNNKKIGQTFKVIIDRVEGDEFVGRTLYDSPEVDNEVIFTKAENKSIGDFVNVKITEATEFDLFGDIV